jgi:hypothetical protein
MGGCELRQRCCGRDAGVEECESGTIGQQWAGHQGARWGGSDRLGWVSPGPPVTPPGHRAPGSSARSRRVALGLARPGCRDPERVIPPAQVDRPGVVEYTAYLARDPVGVVPPRHEERPLQGRREIGVSAWWWHSPPAQASAASAWADRIGLSGRRSGSADGMDLSDWRSGSAHGVGLSGRRTARRSVPATIWPSGLKPRASSRRPHPHGMYKLLNNSY